MPSQDLSIVLSAVNNASKELDNVRESVAGIATETEKANKKVSDSTKQTLDDLKNIGKGMTVIGGAITGFFGLATKSAMDADLTMSKVDTTLKAMEGTTKTVITGTRNLTDEELANSEAVRKNMLEYHQLENSIEKNNLAQTKLDDQLSKGKITKEEHRIATKNLSLEFEELGYKMAECDRKDEEFQATQIDLTETVTLTGEAIAKARESIVQAGSQRLN